MRILIVTQYIAPEPFPINALLLPLRNAGAELIVLTGHPNYPDGQFYGGHRGWTITTSSTSDGVRLVRIPTVARGKGSRIKLALNYVAFVVSASILGPILLRRERVDCVLVYAPSPITQSLVGLVLARMKGVPLITWVQDLWPQSLSSTGVLKNQRLLHLVEQMVAWLYRRHTTILGQSRAFVSEISRLSAHVPVQYVPNAASPIDMTSTLDAHEHGATGTGFNVLFAGNIGSLQAIDTILDAAQILAHESRIHFSLCGSGSRSTWLTSEIERRGLHNVSFLGRFPPSEMPKVYSRADALLVTLARRPALSQTVPSKLQSYLSTGLPILGSLDGEGADLIQSNAVGLVSAAEDSAALAANVLILSRTPKCQRAEMGLRARALFARDFHPDRVAALLLEALRPIVSGAAAGERGGMSDDPGTSPRGGTHRA